MGDYDNWHNHFGCQWIGIYYVDLPEGEATELMDFDGKVEQAKVKKVVLIFPSGYAHRSPPKIMKIIKQSLRLTSVLQPSIRRRC